MHVLPALPALRTARAPHAAHTRTARTLATLRTPRRSPVWASPLRPGKLAAYDAALTYVRADALALRREAAALRTRPPAAGAGAEEQRRTRERLWLLDVQSEVNLPEVRHAFRTGRYPFQRPVYRHLAEQQWRHDGPLDLLMERLHQMHVVPDVLPALHPTVDLRVQFPPAARAPPGLPPPAHHHHHHHRMRPRSVHERAREKQGFSSVLPGEFLAVAQTLAPPRIAATVFHSDTRYYTLLMLDPDVPDPQHNTYTTFLHWMHPNIPLSATRRIVRIPPPSAATPHLPYVPPHPHRGTGYHRYVLLLLPHPAPQPLDIPIPADPERLGFSVRDFVARWGIGLGSAVPPKGGVLGSGAQAGGGGACMWRAVWDAGVPAIWRDVLRAPEPQYGRAPKPDPYAHLKTTSRYSCEK